MQTPISSYLEMNVYNNRKSRPRVLEEGMNAQKSKKGSAFTGGSKSLHVPGKLGSRDPEPAVLGSRGFVGVLIPCYQGGISVQE
jgi:hypothetical protein